MEAIRPHFHEIVALVRFAGCAVLVFGAVRIARAPVQAARTASYHRGLVDFYRISGALAILAGIVLVLVTFFAG